MLDIEQFREHVVDPALRAIAMWSPAAERLLLGTALQESGFRYLAQRGGGPGRGLYQIEPETERDVWTNYLAYRPQLAARVRGFGVAGPGEAHLVGNLPYATAVARLIYFRAPEALPGADDIDGLADYWKRYYNTERGAGTAAAFARKLRKYLDK